MNISVKSNQTKRYAAGLSIASNTVLVLIKLIVGLISGAVSVISEAIHSGVDLLAAVIAWMAVRTSGAPADKTHPFGHGKFENLSGTIEALLIFLAAGWIIYEAVYKLIKPEPVSDIGLAVAVMLLSTIVNLFISSYLMKVGKQTDSVALLADAWHLRTDVYTSAGVMVGLTAMWIGRRLFPSLNLYWIDPIIAIMVALLIIYAAWELTIQAGSDLVDVALADDEMAWLQAYLTSFAPLINGFHNLKTRKAGSTRFIDMHAVVDAQMSVLESHAITERITVGLCDRFADVQVNIHIEPCAVTKPDNNCSTRCLTGCLLSKHIETKDV